MLGGQGNQRPLDWGGGAVLMKAQLKNNPVKHPDHDVVATPAAGQGDDGELSLEQVILGEAGTPGLGRSTQPE